jgi:hypothetical protein
VLLAHSDDARIVSGARLSMRRADFSTQEVSGLALEREQGEAVY